MRKIKNFRSEYYDVVLKQLSEKRLPKSAKFIKKDKNLLDEPPEKYAPKDASGYTAQETGDPGILYIKYYHYNKKQN